MNQNVQEERQEETQILEVDRRRIIIPICCQEGHANCPHVAKKLQTKKRNVGL